MIAPLCEFFQTLVRDILIPMSVVMAIITVFALGGAYIVSGVYPEAMGQLKQAPKNMIIGVIIIVVGPAIIGILITAMGATSECTITLTENAVRMLF
jgi:ABC-type transport system involved in cytochrome c biogenesis permease subunit